MLGLAAETSTEAWSELPICPGAGGSAVAIRTSSGTGLGWSFDPTPPGWNAWLAVDAGGEPGAAAPLPLPPGSFEGWIVVDAQSVPFGESAEIIWWRDDGMTPIATVVGAAACDCHVTRAPLTVQPAVFRLDPPRPNPARRGVDLTWSLSRPGRVRVIVSTVAGRTVKVLLDGELPAGKHGTDWAGDVAGGRRAPAGVYFIRLEQGAERATRKVVLTR